MDYGRDDFKDQVLPLSLAAVFSSKAIVTISVSGLRDSSHN